MSDAWGRPWPWELNKKVSSIDWPSEEEVLVRARMCLDDVIRLDRAGVLTLKEKRAFFNGEDYGVVMCETRKPDYSGIIRHIQKGGLG